MITPCFFSQVYHDLLRSEEEFVGELRAAVDHYVRALDSPSVPEAIRANREQLSLNLAELYNFHANVMLKGLQYYGDDPGKVGQTFVRLEGDFDHHVQFYKQLPQALDLLEVEPYASFFQKLSDRSEAGSRSFADHLAAVADRMTHYQNYFREFVKYSSRLGVSTKGMQRALELCLSVPQRVSDLDFLENITGYPGDPLKLGRIIRHDSFLVSEGDETTTERRHAFLFRNKLMLTTKIEGSPTKYEHIASLRLDKYTARKYGADEDTIHFKPSELGLPTFRLKSEDPGGEYVVKAWLKDVELDREEYVSSRGHIRPLETPVHRNRA
ncbi:unnamed protein product, partial [Mesorhabditis spiculigera]